MIICGFFVACSGPFAIPLAKGPSAAPKIYNPQKQQSPHKAGFALDQSWLRT
jgi:hypothetical protein